MVELGYGTQYSDWAAGWAIRELWFNTQHGHEIFQFSKMSRPTLGPMQVPIQVSVPGVLSTTVKQPGHKAGLSLPSNVEVTNEWSCSSTPLYVFMVYTGTTLP
jgi:hypothetical protein